MRKVYCDHCGKRMEKYFPKEHARKDIGKMDDLCCLDEQQFNHLTDQNMSLLEVIMSTLDHEFDLCDECTDWVNESISNSIEAYFNTKNKQDEMMHQKIKVYCDHCGKRMEKYFICQVKEKK